MFEDDAEISSTAIPSSKYSRIRKRLQEAGADVVEVGDIDDMLAQDESEKEFCKMSGDDLSSEESEESEEEEEEEENPENIGNGHRSSRKRARSSSDEDEDTVESDNTETLSPPKQWKRKKNKAKVKCALCELATSSLVKAMDSVMEKLAGKAGDRHITDMQLQIFERRVKPLRLEGRDIPNINAKIIRLHYRNHCVNVIRSVAEDIHTVELAERTLRRSGLCSKDDDDEKRLHSQAVNDLHKLSRTKLDLLKFFNTLEKARKEEELNGTQNN